MQKSTAHVLGITLDQTQHERLQKPLRLYWFHPHFNGKELTTDNNDKTNKQSNSHFYSLPVVVEPGIYIYRFCDKFDKQGFLIPGEDVLKYWDEEWNVFVVGYQYSHELIQHLYNVIDSLWRGNDCDSEIELFLNKFPNFNINTSFTFDDTSFGSLLHVSSIEGRKNTLSLLLKKNADTTLLFSSSVNDWNNKMGLQLAERQRHDEIANILLEHENYLRESERLTNEKTESSHEIESDSEKYLKEIEKLRIEIVSLKTERLEHIKNTVHQINQSIISESDSRHNDDLEVKEVNDLTVKLHEKQEQLLLHFSVIVDNLNKVIKEKDTQLRLSEEENSKLKNENEQLKKNSIK